MSVTLLYFFCPMAFLLFGLSIFLAGKIFEISSVKTIGEVMGYEERLDHENSVIQHPVIRYRTRDGQEFMTLPFG